MKNKPYKELHFRVDTMGLLTEIADCGIKETMGVLKVPLNVFKNLLGQVAQRATELNDPILDRIMFDLNLYEVPSPTSKEYHEIMERLYKRADEFTKRKKATT